MMTSYVTLYHDNNQLGKGFYPVTTRNSVCDTEISLGYEYGSHGWHQVSGPRVTTYSAEDFVKICLKLAQVTEAF